MSSGAKKNTISFLKEKISMILFVVILGTSLTTALVWVNDYTAPLIVKNQARKIQTSVLNALNIPYNQEDIEEIFIKNIKVDKKKEGEIYLSRKKDVAFEFFGSGLWGPIHGVLALGPDLKTIKGITIIHQEETPGLGGRIAEKDFLNQFISKEILPRISIVKPGQAQKNNEVDGITGATLSGKAFEEILNSESAKYLSLIKRSGK